MSEETAGRERPGQVVYGALYDAFLEAYPDLPEDIKTTLEAWWVAKHI